MMVQERLKLKMTWQKMLMLISWQMMANGWGDNRQQSLVMNGDEIFIMVILGRVNMTAANICYCYCCGIFNQH